MVEIAGKRGRNAKTGPSIKKNQRGRFQRFVPGTKTGVVEGVHQKRRPTRGEGRRESRRQKSPERGDGSTRLEKVRQREKRVNRAKNGRCSWVSKGKEGREGGGEGGKGGEAKSSGTVRNTPYRTGHQMGPVQNQNQNTQCPWNRDFTAE